VGARHNEDLPIAQKERVKTRARLAKKALSTDDSTELFGPEVACDPSRQISQPNAVTACQEHSPEVRRRRIQLRAAFVIKAVIPKCLSHPLANVTSSYCFGPTQELLFVPLANWHNQI
jgi:hypothetical protein